jgi:3-keto-disaccharide hydrolase
MRMQFSLLVGIALIVTGGLRAADDNPAYTNAKDAGPDFAIQGEYLGTAGDHTWGAQVIALGDGKFDLVGFQGGLPGEGWKRGEEMRKATGDSKDGIATLKGDHFTVTIKDSVATVTGEGGDKLGELKKVERKSPTLGAKPPAGAKVLFDGTTVENFENGKIVEENLLGATGCKSKLPVADHSLHIEFRTPFMPKSRGQGRGNSGVHVQGRYEVQVLDSFGLEGKNNECGGIYVIAEPAVNMCLPPLAWQTYDIDFKAAKYDANGKKTENARMTVKHNGVLIHDNVDLKDGNPGADKEGPGKNALYLQNHGNPVAFRNIWVVEK